MTASAPADAAVPAWLRRTGAISWRVLAIAGLAGVTIWLALLLGTVTVSVLLSLIVAATFAPLVRSLRARGWSSTKAAAAVTVAAIVVATAIIGLLAVTFIPGLGDMAGAIQAGLDELRAGLAAVSVPPVVGDQVEAAVLDAEAWTGSGLGELVDAIGFAISVAVLALFLSFFVLLDGERAWLWLLQVATGEKRERIDVSGRDALDRVGGYLRGTAVLSAVRAVAYALFLWAFDVDVVLPLAVLVLLGGFVPYIGGIVALAVVVIVALGSVGAQSTLILLVLMLVVDAVVGNVLRPMLYSKSVHLHPAIVLIAIPAGAAIAGLIGVFFAIPATALGVAIGGAVVEALEPETDPLRERLVAGWVDRLAQWSWRLLAAFGAAALAIFIIGRAPHVVTPVVVAIVVAASVAPLALWLGRRGWPSRRAALAATGGVFAVILGLVLIALAQVAGPVAEAVRAAMESAAELEDDASGSLAWLELGAQDIGGSMLEAMGGVVRAVGAIAVVILLAALLSFYFLRDGVRAWEAMVERASPWRRDALDDAGRDAVRILGGYMFGTAAISAVGAISQFAIMTLFGLPFAVPIAILSFILGFIPYIGGFLTTGMAFLIAVGYGTQTEIAIMFVWTIAINIVQGNIVTPIVYKRAVNLHPALVLLAIPAGGALAGIAGMFLAVPILAVIAATWRAVLYVMGERPPIPSPMTVEERAKPARPGGGSEVLGPLPAD